MKPFRRSKRTGSWGDPKAFTLKKAYPPGLKGYSEPETGSNHPGNLILSKNVRLNLLKRETFMSNNTIVIGGTGTGKTFHFATPNVLQGRTSYLVVDYDGAIIGNTYSSLQKNGYDIKVLNLKDLSHSCMYNPFRYIHNEDDAITMSTCLLKTSEDSRLFFNQAKHNLLSSLILYMNDNISFLSQNFSKLIDLLSLIKTDEDSPDAKSELDKMFERYEENDPDAAGVKLYKSFRQLDVKSRKASIMSLFMDLTPFTRSDIRTLTSDDSIYLNEIGDHKQAIFIVVPFNTRMYDKLVALAITQAVNIIYKKCALKDSVAGVEWNGAFHEQTKPFNPDSPDALIVRSLLDNQLELDRTATVCESGDPLRPYCCKTMNGRPVFYGAAYPEARPAMFETKEQAEYFLKGIKEGHLSKHNNDICSPVHVIFDGNIADTCVIPDFKDILTASLKFSLFFTIMVQNLHQLSTIFEGDIDTALESCGTLLFFGSNSLDTAEFVSRRLGNGPDGTPLMPTAEVLKFSSRAPRECLIMASGMPPISDDVFPTPEHPNMDRHWYSNELDLSLHFKTGKKWDSTPEKSETITMGEPALNKD